MAHRNRPPPGGGGDSHMKWTGMLVVSLSGVNFGFWSSLGCSGQNVIIFSRQGLVQGCTRRNNKKERILIRYIYPFRGLHNVRPHPNWSLLGLKFKISDEHPRPFHMGVPPPPPSRAVCTGFESADIYRVPLVPSNTSTLVGKNLHEIPRNFFQ